MDQFQFAGAAPREDHVGLELLEKIVMGRRKNKREGGEASLFGAIDEAAHGAAEGSGGNAVQGGAPFIREEYSLEWGWCIYSGGKLYSGGEAMTLTVRDRPDWSEPRPGLGEADGCKEAGCLLVRHGIKCIDHGGCRLSWCFLADLYENTILGLGRVCDRTKGRGLAATGGAGEEEDLPW